MALSIDSWNIEPNRLWYVRLAAGVSGIEVELYSTQADAEAQANAQASGVSSAFGSGLPVVLANISGALYPVSLFQDALDWHLLVSGQDIDPVAIFQVKEFIDLDDINDPIFRNAELILTRAAAEIDAHTHATITEDLDLGSHVPDLEPGDILQVDSDRRGTPYLFQISEHRISGQIGSDGTASLTSSPAARRYLALRR